MDILNLYGNDIRTTLTVLAAVISVLGAVWRLRRQRPKLYYGFQPTPSVTLSADGRRQYWDLRTQHPDKYVFTTDVFIGNRGGIAIRREDFDGDQPITLNVREHREIAHVELGQPSPADLCPEFSQPTSHVLAFPPLLLNAGDVVALKAVIVAGDPSPEAERTNQTRAQFHARIAGITQYDPSPWLVRQGLPPAKVREILKGARRPAVLTLVVALVYLVLLLVLPSVIHAPIQVCNSNNTQVCAFLRQRMGVDLTQGVGVDVFTLLAAAYTILTALYYVVAAIGRPIFDILKLRFENRRANRADEQEHRQGAQQGG